MNRVAISNAVFGVLIFGSLAGTTYFRTSRPEPRSVSSLEPGATVRLSAASEIQSGRSGATRGCRVFVVFGAVCPHCHRLAEAEAKRRLTDSTAWVWVTPDTGKSVAQFAALLPSDTRVLSDTSIGDNWGLRGVPALYVVDSMDVLRLVSGASGRTKLPQLSCALRT